MRILYDENGAYDLVHVIAILPIHSQTNLAGSTTRNQPTTKILLQGGHTFSVNLPHQDVLAAWVKVKNSEGHPVDRDYDTAPPADETPKTGETQQ